MSYQKDTSHCSEVHLGLPSKQCQTHDLKEKENKTSLQPVSRPVEQSLGFQNCGNKQARFENGRGKRPVCEQFKYMLPYASFG